MDEERRTTVNLDACIGLAKERCCFINTGFLDRTGDEIHTSMRLGPMLTKGLIKQAAWRTSYEAWNVLLGLKNGLAGQAQIGKGMWDQPANMKGMYDTKAASSTTTGATTAWVPSPVGATLHALHYHEVSVAATQATKSSDAADADYDAMLLDIVTPPVGACDADAVASELQNQVQGILGYVARWVQFGVGCSTVMDVNDIGRMEDRATLRISAQHVANWKLHGIVSEAQINTVFGEMARKVDAQNASDSRYTPMVGREAGGKGVIAFTAARELVAEGLTAPNGYTEGVLCKYRLEAKAAEKAPKRKMKLKARGGAKETAELKAIRISTGIVKRTLKDIQYDVKECTRESEKLAKMQADGAEAHDVSKQEEILAECTTSLERSQAQIGGAKSELAALVEASAGDAEATASPIYTAAVAVLAME